MPEDNIPHGGFGPEAWAPLAAGFQAFHRGETDEVLLIHDDEGEAELMPLSLFFRTREVGLRDVDLRALELSRGRVLDVGAGVGGMALHLQERGLEVTALETIPEAVEIMRERGVGDAVLGRLEEFRPATGFDTILLLMNGTALAGTLAGLLPLLSTLQRLLAPGGQVLLDSTDLTGGEEGPWGEGEYPGELQYQIEFRREKGAPFPQLFVDPRTLGQVAEEGGWRMELVMEGKEGEYLARLTSSSG